MYIHPFVLGVLTTVAVEFLAVCIYAVVSTRKKQLMG